MSLFSVHLQPVYVAASIYKYTALYTGTKRNVMFVCGHVTPRRLALIHDEYLQCGDLSYGRWVYVYLEDVQALLHLLEFEVYRRKFLKGARGRNILDNLPVLKSI